MSVLRTVATAIVCLALGVALWAPVAVGSDQAFPRTAVAVLAAETRFETNASVLTPDGQDALFRLLDKLNQFEQILSIRVVGHTDDVGAAEYNRRLSAQRALTISRFVEKNLPTVQIVAVGAGEASPIASNRTAAGRFRNRRVELHVVATAVRPVD